MCVANRRTESQFNETAKIHSCNVRTIWVITQVFREYFFTSVRGGETGLDRYSWRTDLLDESLIMFSVQRPKQGILRHYRNKILNPSEIQSDEWELRLTIRRILILNPYSVIGIPYVRETTL